MSLQVPIRRLPHAADLPLPAYGTKGSAAVDLCATVMDSIILQPGTWELIPTGIAIATPEGYEAQIRPRSGLALKHGITVLNAPGTIDSDYRGEVQVILINHGRKPFKIERGMRIAQLLIAPYTRVEWEVVVTLDAKTERGSNGFGSTGVAA